MSSLSDYSESGRIPCLKGVKASEKSNFSQTCTLLSQYMKQKGGLGDLSLGMSRNLEGKGKPETFHQTTTTLNLLPNLEISAESLGVLEQNAAASPDLKSMDLFPQQAGFHASVSTEDVPKTTDVRPVKTAPMTILYAGKVLVFDNFPEDKAREVMLLASNGSLSGNFVSSSSNDQLNHRLPTSGNNKNNERVQLPPRPNVSDLPIARKASLHRFLEKRKDRISAKAPYPVSSSGGTSSKPAESKAWLGLASEPSKQFDLHL